MAVHQWLMPVCMRVARAWCDGRQVRVIVMLVASAMDVFVAVLHDVVRMWMFVPFAQVQRHTDGHEPTGDQQLRRNGIPKQDDGQ